MVVLIYNMGGARSEKRIELDGPWNLEAVENAVSKYMPSLSFATEVEVEYDGALQWSVRVDGERFGTVRARAEVEGK